MRERLFEQTLYPTVMLDEVPAVLLFETLDGTHSRFAALSPLDQALECLEYMEAINIKPAIGDGDGVLLGRAKWCVDGRNPICDGHRRTSEHRKLQLFSDLHHAPRLPPVEGEMLVVEHRHGSPLWRKTSVILRNISKRGYSVCPLSLTG